MQDVLKLQNESFSLQTYMDEENLASGGIPLCKF